MASTASPPSRGCLVVVEGLDRSGKSSQCQILHDKLKEKGRDVRYVKFPDRSTPTGKMINSYLTGQVHQEDHCIHLIFSANRWEAVKSIHDDSANGVVIIIDRYSYSGAVYSAAKDNPELSLEWAWHPEIGLPCPDVTIFLDISSADAARRGGYGAERYETEKMQTRVRSLFQHLFSRVENLNLLKIDAGRPIDAVAKDVMEAVLRAIESPVLRESMEKLKPLKPSTGSESH